MKWIKLIVPPLNLYNSRTWLRSMYEDSKKETFYGPPQNTSMSESHTTQTETSKPTTIPIHNGVWSSGVKSESSPSNSDTTHSQKTEKPTNCSDNLSGSKENN